MNVIFDLDGTLVDIWPRYFSVFTELAQGSGYTLEQYRAAKKELRLDGEVAKVLGVTLPDNYPDKKRALLESSDMLALDELIVPFSSLDEWVRSNRGIIVTKRRNKASAIRQLDTLGLSNIMSEIYVLNPDEGKSKSDWVREQRNPSFHECSMVVGDGPEDMELGCALGTETVFVESGLNVLGYIKERYPFVKSVSNVNDILNSR